MRRYTWLMLFCLVAWSLSACAPSSTPIDQATYQAVPLKGDPVSTFSTTNDMLLIEITSPTGIGSTRIEKLSGLWPPQIVMRLHVKGLESFKFRYNTTIINVSVSSHGDNAVTEEYQQQGKVGVVSAGDPYWIAVTHGDGYFDLTAPADFHKSGASQFTIEWVDFYR